MVNNGSRELKIREKDMSELLEHTLNLLKYLHLLQSYPLIGDETSLVIKGMWRDPSTEGLPLIGVFINPINVDIGNTS